MKRMTRISVEYIEDNDSSAVLTFPNTQFGLKLIIRFGKTQKTPTKKSATARFAKKKFVIVLIF